MTKTTESTTDQEFVVPKMLGGNLPRRDITLPLVAAIAAMVAVVVIVWSLLP